jgi:DNA-binding response OmpR family regulator
MKSILILEDNKVINDILKEILSESHYQVYQAFNAFDALKTFNDNSIDCIITDLMLPIMSGEAFIKEIRKQSNVHIIVISAKTDVEDKLNGLKIGADDYLYKPFLEEEVLIKINNLFNKIDQKHTSLTFNHSDVVYTKGNPIILFNGQPIEFTAIEFRMITLFVYNPNKVLSRELFIEHLYQYNEETYDRTIDVHIRNIRKKIKTVYPKEIIKTIYGLGYMFVGEKDA